MTSKTCRKNTDYVRRFTPETLGLLRTAPSLSDAMSILLPTSQGDMANCPDQKLNEINLCWSFCERWEPSWEPFAVDCCGRLWMAMDSEPSCSGRYGLLRTPMDGVRPSTDQKVGDSSSSGRADRTVAVQGLRRVAVLAVFARRDLGSHSPSTRRTSDRSSGILVANAHLMLTPIGRPEPLHKRAPKCRSRAH